MDKKLPVISIMGSTCTGKTELAIKLQEKFPIEIIVTPTAISIPTIPKKFPLREVSGEERPLRANIKRTPDIK